MEVKVLHETPPNPKKRIIPTEVVEITYPPLKNIKNRFFLPEHNASHNMQTLTKIVKKSSPKNSGFNLPRNGKTADFSAKTDKISNFKSKNGKNSGNDQINSGSDTDDFANFGDFSEPDFADFSPLKAKSGPHDLYSQSSTGLTEEFSESTNCPDPFWGKTAFDWDTEVLSLLATFGLSRFRKNQREIINASLSGKDVFVLMPTGGGKSLCYQLSALIYEGTTVVISPLISLIQDQVSALTARNIPVAAFMSGCDIPADTWQNLRNCSLKLLYVTPEKFLSSEAIKQNLLKAERPPRFVIDEAHCVSSWGHDFRPDYMALSKIKTIFRNAPVMAMTATATDIVKKEIIKNLNLGADTVCFRQSFNRPNLEFSVVAKRAKPIDQLVEFIAARHTLHSGIVYCYSRKETEAVAIGLQNSNVNAYHYHAGMAAKQRADVQDNWSNDRFKVIVATVAFGMGIDKPDVRFVVHFTLPKSPENYYQEAGRAGRDGGPASCVLMYSYRDKARVEYVLRKNENQEKLTRDIGTLYKMVQFCENKVECRRTQILGYFGEKFDGTLCRKSCDNCKASAATETKDFSREMAALADAAQLLAAKGLLKSKTLMAVFRGSKCREAAEADLEAHDVFGAGRAVELSDAHRLLHRAFERGVLEETVAANKFGGLQATLRLGPSFSAARREAFAMQVVAGTRGTVCPLAPGMTPDLAISLFGELEEARARLQRQSVCAALPKGLNIRNIMPNEALMVFAAELPRTQTQMARVHQVGESKFRKDFLAVVAAFAKRNGLQLSRGRLLSQRCSPVLQRLLLPHSSCTVVDLAN